MSTIVKRNWLVVILSLAACTRLETGGRFTYLILSFLVFVVGFTAWLTQVESAQGIGFSAHPGKYWLGLAIIAGTFGAISPANLGLLELGAFFALLIPLSRGQIYLPFFFLGLLAEVKFQTFPVLGLALLVMMSLGGNLLPAIFSAAAGFLVGEAATMLVTSPQLWSALAHTRLENLGQLAGDYWKGPLALVFATGLFVHMSYWRERLPISETRVLAFLLAVVFGVTLNNFVLSLPLLLLLILMLKTQRAWPLAWTGP